MIALIESVENGIKLQTFANTSVTSVQMNYNDSNQYPNCNNYMVTVAQSSFSTINGLFHHYKA